MSAKRKPFSSFTFNSRDEFKQYINYDNMIKKVLDAINDQLL